MSLPKSQKQKFKKKSYSLFTVGIRNWKIPLFTQDQENVKMK